MPLRTCSESPLSAQSDHGKGSFRSGIAMIESTAKLIPCDGDKPMQALLTINQETFANGVVEGRSLSDAYRHAYNAERLKSQVIHVEASRLAANPKVALRLDELTREKDEDRRMQAIKRKDFVLDGLMRESVNAASDSARVRSLELMGKTIGMFDGRQKDEEVPQLTSAELEQEILKRLTCFSGN